MSKRLTNEQIDELLVEMLRDRRGNRGHGFVMLCRETLPALLDELRDLRAEVVASRKALEPALHVTTRPDYDNLYSDVVVSEARCKWCGVSVSYTYLRSVTLSAHTSDAFERLVEDDLRKKIESSGCPHTRMPAPGRERLELERKKALRERTVPEAMPTEPAIDFEEARRVYEELARSPRHSDKPDDK